MIFTILGLCFYYVLDVFFEIYFDRNIMYLDQSTPRHQGQNRAFELELLKNQEFQYHDISLDFNHHINYYIKRNISLLYKYNGNGVKT